jgi:hypothetical protein
MVKIMLDLCFPGVTLMLKLCGSGQNYAFTYITLWGGRAMEASPPYALTHGAAVPGCFYGMIPYCALVVRGARFPLCSVALLGNSRQGHGLMNYRYVYRADGLPLAHGERARGGLLHLPSGSTQP